MKPQYYFRHVIALFIALMAVNGSYGQGSVRAMYFPGSGVLTPTPIATTNSFVDLGTALKDSLATTSFTIELWVKMGAANTVNPVIIGDKDWASGSNTGFVLSYYASTDAASGTAAANTIRFNLRASGGTRLDYDIVFPLVLALQWNHIAFTINRSGSVVGYLNGIQTGKPYTAGTDNISADAGKTLAGTLPVRLGTDGKPYGYRAPFNGMMDEVRIWKTVRTAQQIRDNMCHTLKALDTTLLAYYRMDDTVGSAIVPNNSLATKGMFNGTIVNGAYRVGSGAPVGDTSVNLYTASWASQSLQLPTATRGIFTIDSIVTPGSFLHLYQVNTVPDSLSGLTNYMDNNVYFGTFASGDSMRYYAQYNYSNYTKALVYKKSIGFYTRVFNADPLWSPKNTLYNNTVSNILRVDSVSGTHQFFLANFIGSCNQPSALGATGIWANSATLGWTSGGATLWNIEYGNTGFTPGTGTKIMAVNSNPYILNGLQGNTAYQYYVQDSCTGMGTSSWAGPYTFTTAPGNKVSGSGRALSLNGSGVQSTTVQAVNLGNALRDTLANGNFTIEMWVKIGATNTGNPPLLGNKDYTSGVNTGLCWTYTGSALFGDAKAHVFRLNFMPNGGTRRDYDMLTPDEHTWNHLAITVDRKGYIKGYVNGVYMPSTYASGAGSIAADSNKTLAGTMPFYLGTDGTGAYRCPLNANMDEVRIWNRVRSDSEIQANMCHKLAGNEGGLVSYYRMDELVGTTIINNALATKGSYNGTIVNGATTVASGAPVGDTSVNIYTATWPGKSLQLSTANRGIFSIDSFAAPGSYLHLYQVNAVPDSVNGLAVYADNNVYFGTFASGDSMHYYPKYSYSNYGNAVTYKNSISFFTRRFNTDAVWNAKNNLYNNTASGMLRVDSIYGTRQFFLANFTSTCNQPSALTASGIAVNSATLGWKTGGAAIWNIEYGTNGFTQGTGTKIKAVNTNNYTLNGLQGNTAYQYYVQDSCTGLGTSSWAGPYSFTTATDYSMFASGYAVNFNGSGVQNSPIQAVNLGGALRDTLATSNFTIEMWVKIGATNTGNPPLLADKDYVSGANTGICWTYTASVLFGDAAAHVFRFNFKPTGGTRRDYDMIAPDEHTWNHLAITVDRKGFIKGYVNGVYMPSLYATGAGTIIADTNKTLAGTMPIYLGTDGTGAYRCPLNANMDEFRVWNRVRSDSEIRATMCHKLNGSEPGLITYYRMDEPGGTTVINSAAATVGTMNATTVNSPAKVISAAPIGDSSVFIYPASGWNGVSLSMATTDNGAVTVDSLSGLGIAGLHIYTVNKAPNFQNGINDIATTNKYLGVFTANNATASYRVQYDYSNYSKAVSNNANLHLYTRPGNASSFWAQLPAAHNTTAHIMTANQYLGVRQYLLADFVTASCLAPYSIKKDSVNGTNVSLSWSSAATWHNTKYGVAGFDFGAVNDTTITGNKQTLTSLLSKSAYEFYIQDSCGAGSTSSWVGPYYFETPNPCPLPTNVIADSITISSMVIKWTDNGSVSTGYNVSWGVSGSFTDPTIGIIQSTTAPRLLLKGLQKSTAYDFYINTNCNASISKSGWAGPFTFKTDTLHPSGINTVEETTDNQMHVYPNPAKNKVFVVIADNNNTTAVTGLSIYNNLGVRMYAPVINQGSHLEINTSGFAPGIYYIQLQSEKGMYHKSVIIQH